MSPSIFPPLLITFLLCFFIKGATSQDNNLINKTCRAFAKHDPNIPFNFCTTSLQAAPASQCAGLRGLGMISIRLIRYNVTDTRCKVRHLLKDKKLDIHVRRALDDCLELYTSAIDLTKDAMKAYNSKRFDDANTVLSAIMTNAGTCEDGFIEDGAVSPLTKRNNDAENLGAIALEFLRILQHPGSS